MLAEGFALLRWDSAYQGRRARRTSLWRRDDVGWRQVHHQGTLLRS
jgi:ribonuclease HI